MMHNKENGTSQAIPANVLREVEARDCFLWVNGKYEPEAVLDSDTLRPEVAQARFDRHAPALASMFGPLAETQGELRSPLVPIPHLQALLVAKAGSCGGGGEDLLAVPMGNWWLKRDDALPVAGSIKARGAFHEVLAVSERVYSKRALIDPSLPVGEISTKEARKLFSEYTISVGSTGNLGLGVGLIAAGLGFNAVVHMSKEAARWKKEMLHTHGIEVVEHVGDYAVAVASGRKAAQADPYIHFVDDERSTDLFLGYAAAAREIEEQLASVRARVDEKHPLFVYLPCGVGGAPGGIAYGLKRRFGKYVHCFFAEPVEAPCMLLQLASGGLNSVTVYDVGLSNNTAADGLAVPQASLFVAEVMGKSISGIFLVDDQTLFHDLHALASSERINVEPSAIAAIRGPLWLTASSAGQAYLRRHGLLDQMRDAQHIIWSTGGSLIPTAERALNAERAQQAFEALDRTGVTI